MSSETFVEAEIWTVAQTDQGNAVLIRPKGSDLAVPIFIGQLETQAILIGLGGVEVPRPLTHDLVLGILDTLETRLARVEICSLREGTFFARLVLDRSGSQLLVDARPSDAIGIAVRRHCPVFIAESVVDEAGISVNLVTEGKTVMSADVGRSPEEGPEGPMRKPVAKGAEDSSPERRRLQEELEKAIEVEDYERAAKIRDRLRDLGG